MKGCAKKGARRVGRRREGSLGLGRRREGSLEMRLEQGERTFPL